MVGNFTSYRERVCWPQCAGKFVVREGVVTSTWKRTLKTATIQKEMYDLDMVMKGQVHQTLRDRG
jgi:hypothetical protein